MDLTGAGGRSTGLPPYPYVYSIAIADLLELLRVECGGHNNQLYVLRGSGTHRGGTPIPIQPKHPLRRIVSSSAGCLASRLSVASAVMPCLTVIAPSRLTAVMRPNPCLVCSLPGLFLRTSLMRPNRTSVASVRSWASSRMITEYLRIGGASWHIQWVLGGGVRDTHPARIGKSWQGQHHAGDRQGQEGSRSASKTASRHVRRHTAVGMEGRTDRHGSGRGAACLTRTPSSLPFHERVCHSLPQQHAVCRHRRRHTGVSLQLTDRQQCYASREGKVRDKEKRSVGRAMGSQPLRFFMIAFVRHHTTPIGVPTYPSTHQSCT